MNLPLTEEQFRDIYAKVPRLCVDLIIRKDDSILLSKRKIDPYRGLWHLPGGTVYFGETLEAAIKRVAQNELGLEVRSKALLGFLEFPDEFKGSWHGWPISLEFEIEVVRGQIRGSTQADEINYFKKLPPATIPTHVRFLIRQFGFEQEKLKK